MTIKDDEGSDTQYEDFDTKPDSEGVLDAGMQALTTNAGSMFFMMRNRDILGGGPHELTFQRSDPSSPVIIRSDSQIAVSMTELDPQGNPKLGAATLQVLNVVPSSGNPGTVTVRFHNSFDFKIPGRFNFIIVN